MKEEIRIERELEEIRRKMMSCVHEMADFMRRVKVSKSDDRERLYPESETTKARAIIKLVAGSCGMTVKRLTNRDSRDRQDSVATARQLAQYILRQSTTLSYPLIAELTGVTNHTTVLHAVRKIERMRASNAEFDAKTRLLISQAVDDDQCPRCEMAKHTGKCEGSSGDIALRADQQLERVRAL